MILYFWKKKNIHCKLHNYIYIYKSTIIQTGEHRFERVNQFPYLRTYLGTIVQMDNKTTNEVKQCINVANLSYF